MVKLIVGSRGSGKTKRLIDAADEAVEKSLGNVVCVEQGNALSGSFKATEIRLIDIDEYNIADTASYYGFISGLLAGNYDTTHIFCDATFKIISGQEKDYKTLEEFILRVDSLGKKHDCVIVFSVSTEADALSPALQAMVV